jgi:hypothetical protein
MADLVVEHPGKDLTNSDRRSSARDALQPMAPIERLPKWLLCVPLVAQWLWLALIHRSTSLPSVLNPGIETGGLVGESKFSYLAPLGSRFRERVADTYPVAPGANALAICERCQLEYPLIAKPDIGWCGYGVRRIDSDAELAAYARAFPRDAVFLLQRFAHEANEAGVLYVRAPGEARGRATALTIRHTPHVFGDGVNTVEQLIAQGVRTQGKAALYRKILNEEALSRVPALGERVPLTTVASVRVGGRYEDATRLITPQIDDAIDAIARAIGDFQDGRFTVIEINGAGSEAIQFWDPNLSMAQAFAGVFAKQRNLFALANAMRKRGHKPVGWRGLAVAHLRQQRLVRQYPSSN